MRPCAHICPKEHTTIGAEPRAGSPHDRASSSTPSARRDQQRHDFADVLSGTSTIVADADTRVDALASAETLLASPTDVGSTAPIRLDRALSLVGAAEATPRERARATFTLARPLGEHGSDPTRAALLAEASDMS